VAERDTVVVPAYRLMEFRATLHLQGTKRQNFNCRLSHTSFPQMQLLNVSFGSILLIKSGFVFFWIFAFREGGPVFGFVLAFFRFCFFSFDFVGFQALGQAVTGLGGGIAVRFASRLRFWTVAASRNSS